MLRTDFWNRENGGMPSPADPEALTPRELEVLEAIERRLTNAEIAEQLVISVRTVESHVAMLRAKLGASSRSELIAAARLRRRAVIQIPRNSFVGRERELAELAMLFDSTRWVTVVGPPGCGKTRLALEFSVRGDRVPVVAELEHANAAAVPRVIAQAVGVAHSSERLLSACGLALESQPYLLVLDNCDRVSDAAEAAIRELLGRAPGLTVLATSRWPLGGSDEDVFTLEPLTVGDLGAATRLFAERAASAAPGVRFSEDERALVADICEHLDGLPLAIELAAARVRHLSVGELASHIRRGSDVLGRPGGTGRHRTLEAAFDWTWDLLDKDEQDVLKALAALPRTFDLDLAEAVTAPDAGRVVLRLLDRSLVAQTLRKGDPRRYRLLDSVRSCVLRRSDGELIDKVRRAHAVYYRDRATELANAIRTDDSHEIIDRARLIGPEVAAAIGWAVENDVTLAIPLARSLAVCAEHCGPDLDSLETLARAAQDRSFLAAATPSELLYIGIALCYGDLALVDQLAECALAASHDDASWLAAHHLAGFADAYNSRTAEALEHLAVAEPLAEKLGETWQLASVRQGRGIALGNEPAGDRTRAIAAFESAAATFALAGDAMHANNCRYMMASSAAQAGLRIGEAIGWAKLCEAYARSTGNAHELAHARLTQAMLLGRDDGQLLAETTDTFRRVGDLRCLTRVSLLRARFDPGRRIAHLEAALRAATIANDTANRIAALEQLTTANWEAAIEREAGLAFGALAALIGRPAAEAKCPPSMLLELGRLEPLIEQGAAHVHRPKPGSRAG